MWQPAVSERDVVKNAGVSLQIAGQRVAVFNVGGKFYAMSDACMHRGGPLGQGHLEGTQVTCPWHAWQFDVTNGKCDTMEGAVQKCYPVKVENGQVYVDL